MSNLRIVIADDERPARELLKSVLREFESVEIVGEAENGADAVELIKSVKPDLAFLDLKMPEIGGLEAVRMLRRSQMPLVVFVTAHDEFAVEAFEMNAVDYLLKPVESSRMAATVRRAIERLEHADWQSIESDRVSRAAEHISGTSAPLERIPVKVRDEIYLIPVNEVISVIADGELLQITTANSKYTINHRLKDLETRLDERHFVRLSRSAIVNIAHVARISPMPGGTYIATLKDGREISASRLQSKLLRNRLLKL